MDLLLAGVHCSTQACIMLSMTDGVSSEGSMARSAAVMSLVQQPKGRRRGIARQIPAWLSS